MTNRAVLETEINGKSTVVKDAPIDPFHGLLTVGSNAPRASVSMTVGRSFNYGEVKVTAHVTLQCDQNKATIDKAAEMAFQKAVEYVNDGLSLLEPHA